MACAPVKCGMVSLSFAIISVVMAVSLPFLVSFIVDQQLRLKPGTIMYGFWEHSPVPMYIKFHMFTVTNSEDVILRGDKPIVQELGPYTFAEVHERVNLTNFENFTLQFQQERYWYYIEELSNGTLQDNVTTFNVPLLSAAYVLRFAPPYIKWGFNQFVELTKSEIFVTRTVAEFLFEGYPDPLLNVSHYLPEGLLDIPDLDKFGWFYGRNGSASYDGVFNIFTGVDDISKLDMMDTWNGVRQTEYYQEDCGKVNGSFGEGWPPRRERKDISLFSTDLCRSLTLYYTNDVSKNGMTFYRFAGTKRTFASVVDDPDNWCFCTAEDDELCSRFSGVVNSSTCHYGAPAFVSFPHYYLADPFFQNQVEGLSPQQELHEFHVDLEPRTAVPLEVAARFQINIQMTPIKGIKAVENVTEVYLPIFWFGVSADLTDKLLLWIHFTLVGPYVGSACFFAVFVACLVAVAVSGVKYSKAKGIPKKNNVEQLENSS